MSTINYRNAVSIETAIIGAARGLRSRVKAMIDTLATARRLEQAGMNAGQAEAVAGEIRTAISEGGVTRADLDAALSALEVRLVKWAVGIALAAVALLIAAGGVLLPLLLG